LNQKLQKISAIIRTPCRSQEKALKQFEALVHVV